MYEKIKAYQTSRWIGLVSVFLVSTIFATLFVNIRTVQINNSPVTLTIENQSQKSFLSIGKINLKVRFEGSAPVKFANFRAPFGVIPIRQLVSNIQDFEVIDANSIISKQSVGTLHIDTDSSFVINFDVESAGEVLVNAGVQTLFVQNTTTFRITPVNDISIISDNLLTPPLQKYTSSTDTYTLYGKYQIDDYSSSPSLYRSQIAFIILKAIVFFFCLFVIFALLLISCARAGRLFLQSVILESKTISVALSSIMGFLVFALTAGALNYLIPGSHIRIFFCIFICIILLNSFIKNPHELRSDAASILKILTCSPVILSTFVIGSIVSYIYRFWNIGLINTDTNGYYFQILDSLSKSYLGQTYDEYRGNFTGYGMRTLDHSIRMLFHSGDANETIIISSLFLVILSLIAIWELPIARRTLFQRELVLFFVPSSSLLAGLWMEGYQTRWFGAVLGIMCVTILVSQIYETNENSDYSKFLVVLLLSIAQISLNPTFFVIPSFSSFFSFYMVAKRNKERVLKGRPKHIFSFSFLMIFMNLFWLRNLRYTIEQGVNGYLDQLANNFVIPFWHTFFMLPFILGIAPWHNNAQSIYGLGTDKLSIIFHDSFYGSLLNQFLSIELFNRDSFSFSKVLVSLSIPTLAGVAVTVLVIRKWKTFRSSLLSNNSNDQFHGVKYILIVIGLAVMLQVILQILLNPRRLYVNSMTLISQMPILVFIVLLIVSIRVNLMKDPEKRFRKNLSIFLIIFYLCVSSFSSIVEYSRWNSGYTSKQGFTYWSYHDLVLGDLSNSSASSPYKIILNETLSDWDKYLVSNFTIRTLLERTRSRCHNCDFRNSEVIIEGRKSSSTFDDNGYSSCFLENKSRLVGVCSLRDESDKR